MKIIVKTKEKIYDTKQKICNFYYDLKTKIHHLCSKIFKCVRDILVIIGLLFIALCLIGGNSQSVSKRITDLLPWNDGKEITSIIIEEKLKPIQKLATSQFEYNGVKCINDARKIFGMDIPLTTKEIDMSYSGVIKVSYDLNEMNYKIVPKNNIVIFCLPEPEIDNYILQNSVVCNEKNNIFNPIYSDEISNYLAIVEDEELQRAEQQGIYEEAENSLKNIVKKCFDEFDYEVMFI